MGFSDTAAFGYVDYVKPYLKRALQAQSVLVKRVFDNQEAFDEAFQGVEDLFIDGSEIIIERAKDQKKQQADFSGKKNAHADHAADLRQSRPHHLRRAAFLRQSDGFYFVQKRTGSV